MAYSFIVSTSKETVNSSDVTSDAIDTTGANLLVVNIGQNSAGGTLSDSKGNSWTPLTFYGRNQMFYSVPTSVGSGHTFTLSGGGFPSISVSAFGGAKAVSPFDAENGNTAVATDPETSGSLTPSEANELVVTAAAFGGVISSIDTPTGFTLGSEVFGTPGVAYGSGIAHKFQGAASAENASWQTHTSGAGMYGVGIACFKAAASGGIVGSHYYRQVAGLGGNV